jgi:hypothetical protein
VKDSRINLSVNIIQVYIIANFRLYIGKGDSSYLIEEYEKSDRLLDSIDVIRGLTDLFGDTNTENLLKSMVVQVYGLVGKAILDSKDNLCSQEALDKIRSVLLEAHMSPVSSFDEWRYRALSEVLVKRLPGFRAI